MAWRIGRYSSHCVLCMAFNCNVKGLVMKVLMLFVLGLTACVTTGGLDEQCNRDGTCDNGLICVAHGGLYSGYIHAGHHCELSNPDMKRL